MGLYMKYVSDLIQEKSQPSSSFMMQNGNNVYFHNYILWESEPPLRISSREISPISFLISDGPAALKVSSANVVVTAIHLQAHQILLKPINLSKWEREEEWGWHSIDDQQKEKKVDRCSTLNWYIWINMLMLYNL